MYRNIMYRNVPEQICGETSSLKKGHDVDEARLVHGTIVRKLG